MDLPNKLQVKKPIVKFKGKNSASTRVGRGYSLKELYESGIKNYRHAKTHGIPVDKLRNTSHKENVDSLRDVTKTVYEPKKVREKPSEDKNAAKPKVIKKRTIRRKLMRND